MSLTLNQFGGASGVSVRSYRVPKCSSGPLRLWDPTSIISSVQDVHEEVRPMCWWMCWCSLDIPRSSVSDASSSVCVCETHYVASPSNLLPSTLSGNFEYGCSSKCAFRQVFTSLNSRLKWPVRLLIEIRSPTGDFGQHGRFQFASHIRFEMWRSVRNCTNCASPHAAILFQILAAVN